MTDSRLQSPAAARNRQPILEVLRQVLPDNARVLEVASGSGEHALHCAADMPSWVWQPSDPHPRALASIAAWRQQVSLPNLAEPVRLDVTDLDSWPAAPFEAVVAINLIHISPWAVTETLMALAEECLMPGGVLYLYGPFCRGGLHVAPSNAVFDADLRRRDPRWGVRDLEEVTAEAERHGLTVECLVEMPANNLSVVFRKG